MSDPISLARSPIWDRLHAGPMADIEGIDLDTFRSSGPVFAISVWDPARNGLRYLKTLLHTLMIRSDPTDAALYHRIPRRDLGKPITVRVHGVDVCLDYFQAVDEAKTIGAGASPRAGARLVEIGPGYGRTCHTLLSLHPQIGEYWLVDLDPCLALTRRYLGRVLDPQAQAKLRFVTPMQFGAVDRDMHFNLAINVDSFGDLPPEVARAYLDLFDQHCDAFYCKNPVGKFLDPALGGDAANSERVRQALESGLARDIIDVFDSDAVSAAVPRFLANYCPSPAWRVALHRPAPPWSYYYQALYLRASE